MPLNDAELVRVRAFLAQTNPTIGELPRRNAIPSSGLIVAHDPTAAAGSRDFAIPGEAGILAALPSTRLLPTPLGTAGQALVVNSGRSGVEWGTVASSGGATWSTGSGAPSGGSNGDWYLRTGGTQPGIYYRSGNSWGLVLAPGAGGGADPTLANVVAALALSAVASTNRGQFIRRQADEDGFEYVGGLLVPTGGTTGQVLKRGAGDSLVWGVDNTGAGGTGISESDALGLIATWARASGATGTIPDGTIPATIARDSEVLAAVGGANLPTLASGTRGMFLRQAAGGEVWEFTTAPMGGTTLTDDAVLDLVKTTRTSADRGKALGVAADNENELAFLDAATASGDVAGFEIEHAYTAGGLTLRRSSPWTTLQSDTITPPSSSAKVGILFRATFDIDVNQILDLRVRRGTTVVHSDTTTVGLNGTPQAEYRFSASLLFVDSPASGAPVTYQIQGRLHQDTGFSASDTFVGDRSLMLISGAGGGQGERGPQGDQGDPGPAGADGADGAAGTDGADGAQGDPGPQGDQGDPGPQGVQGRYAVTIFRNAATAPGTPTGGSVVVATGAVTVPTGWTTSPTAPGGSENTYASRVTINPASQTGTVTPTWSAVFEAGGTGPAGPAGADGAPGPKGDKGDKGDTGDQGPAGADGVATFVQPESASLSGGRTSAGSAVMTVDNAPSPFVPGSIITARTTGSGGTLTIAAGRYLVAFLVSRINFADNADEASPQIVIRRAADDEILSHSTSLHIENHSSTSTTGDYDDVQLFAYLDLAQSEVVEFAVQNTGETRTANDNFDFANTAVTFLPQNTSGPAGPQGDSGPQGDPGPQGDQGDTGPQGAQGRYEITIFRNASAAPATPTGGSVVVATGVVTPPSGWSTNPSTPGDGENIYASRVEIDPGSQSGTVTPTWSAVYEAGGTGPAGPRGADGSDGAQGDPGPKGDQGDKGDPGAARAARIERVTFGSYVPAASEAGGELTPLQPTPLSVVAGGGPNSNLLGVSGSDITVAAGIYLVKFDVSANTASNDTGVVFEIRDASDDSVIAPTSPSMLPSNVPTRVGKLALLELAAETVINIYKRNVASTLSRTVSLSAGSTADFANLLTGPRGPAGPQGLTSVRTQALTDAAALIWNVDNGEVGTVTLGGSRTLSVPSGGQDGGVYMLRIKQDATGGRTMALHNDIDLGDEVAPVLSTEPGALDLLMFTRVGASEWLYLGIKKGYEAAAPPPAPARKRYIGWSAAAVPTQDELDAAMEHTVDALGIPRETDNGFLFFAVETPLGAPRAVYFDGNTHDILGGFTQRTGGTIDSTAVLIWSTNVLQSAAILGTGMRVLTLDFGR